MALTNHPIDLDLGKQQLKNAKLGNLITFPTLVSGDAGYTFYHTVNKKVYTWDGSAWLDLTGGAINGLPIGGSGGQILAKIDGTDYNVEWIDAPSGGGTQNLQSVTTEGNTTNNGISITNSFFNAESVGTDKYYMYFNASGLRLSQSGSTLNPLTFNRIADEWSILAPTTVDAGTSQQRIVFPNVDVISDSVFAQGFEVKGAAWIEGNLRIGNTGAQAYIDTSNLTNAWSFNFPNKSGTIALLDDISGATPTLQAVTDAGATTDNNITFNSSSIVFNGYGTNSNGATGRITYTDAGEYKFFQEGSTGGVRFLIDSNHTSFGTTLKFPALTTTLVGESAMLALFPNFTATFKYYYNLADLTTIVYDADFIYLFNTGGTNYLLVKKSEVDIPTPLFIVDIFDNPNNLIRLAVNDTTYSIDRQFIGNGINFKPTDIALADTDTTNYYSYELITAGPYGAPGTDIATFTAKIYINVLGTAL